MHALGCSIRVAGRVDPWLKLLRQGSSAHLFTLSEQKLRRDVNNEGSVELDSRAVRPGPLAASFRSQSIIAFPASGSALSHERDRYLQYLYLPPPCLPFECVHGAFAFIHPSNHPS